MKIIKSLIIMSLVLFSFPVCGEEKKGVFSYFKDLETDIFPIPVIESRPDEGESYGLMPVLVMSDTADAIKAIFAAIGQYNSIIHTSGAALAYLYPEPDQEILFYGELAQDYMREFSFRYFNPTLKDKIFVESDIIFQKTPFGFFYGIGPERSEDNGSNFTSRNFRVDVTGGYWFWKNIRANLGIKFHTTDLLDRGNPDYDNMLARYGALPEVSDSTNFILEPSIVFDNRENGEYSSAGSYAQLSFFTSNQSLGSDKTFRGMDLELIHLFPLIKERIITALRFHFEQLWGSSIPFYEQASLGGPDEMRAFIPNRFVDRGKMVFQLEERIKLFGMKLFGNPFEVHADPFFELGRVFDSANHLGFNHWQPVGGMGLRLFVPPNVVGRLDIAIGPEGMEMYTALGYPF